MGEQTGEGQLAEEVQEPGSKSSAHTLGSFSTQTLAQPCVHTERKGNNQVFITAYLFPMTISWGDYSQSLSIFSI